MIESPHNRRIQEEVGERERQHEALQRAQIVLEGLSDLSYVTLERILVGITPGTLNAMREIFGLESMVKIKSELKESAQVVGIIADQQRISIAASRELKIEPLPDGAEPPPSY